MIRVLGFCLIYQQLLSAKSNPLKSKCTVQSGDHQCSYFFSDADENGPFSKLGLHLFDCS